MKSEYASNAGRALLEVLVALTLTSVILPALISTVHFLFERASLSEQSFRDLAERHAGSINTDGQCRSAGDTVFQHWICWSAQEQNRHFISYSNETE